MGMISATWHLFLVSFLRLIRSRQTMVSLLLLGFAALAVVAWALRRERTPAQFTEEVFLTLFSSLLVPIFCLSFGTAGIASDREEQTLVYLLVAPLPRPCVFLAKALASLVPALLWTVGSLALLCRLAGRPGAEAWGALWPSVVWSTVAYVSLFLLFSVLFRRATLLALAYSLFLETLVGNLPGIAKRMAVSFYLKCLVFESSESFGLRLQGLFQPELFLPVSGSTAQLVLLALSGLFFLVAMIIFSVREYAAAS
ncbi:MAG: hypothetical protein U0935_05560 [Pirellulales bacterium]